ncbi:Os09g0267500 [Oryza sativa Japonica Group]|uniref:Os09g0267500 protein n=2 Tax=Oryza sativa subsp. japonica TaxID=39947 RepID=Q6H4U1_ORYSJ|nr:unknown protein [Oryza sativa Japonica Group]BAT07145.1 Os09g0267500 [Oryza sativa Japonica Group]
MGFVDPAAPLLATCGGDTVKLFDVTVESGDPCVLAYTPAPAHPVNAVRWNHTSEYPQPRLAGSTACPLVPPPALLSPPPSPSQISRVGFTFGVVRARISRWAAGASRPWGSVLSGRFELRVSALPCLIERCPCRVVMR